MTLPDYLNISLIVLIILLPPTHSLLVTVNLLCFIMPFMCLRILFVAIEVHCLCSEIDSKFKIFLIFDSILLHGSLQASVDFFCLPVREGTNLVIST